MKCCGAHDIFDELWLQVAQARLDEQDFLAVIQALVEEDAAAGGAFHGESGSCWSTPQPGVV